jgi:hypothetical protein
MIVALASRLAQHLDGQFHADASQTELRARAAMPG